MLSRNICNTSNRIRKFSNYVKIVEVGPRDGLQNEKKILSSSIKVELINRLSKSGLKTIEVTSFVSPKWIPQMQDNATVFKNIYKEVGVSYPVLIPNLEGLKRALEVDVQEIAIFGAASESFSHKNINCSIDESINRFKEVIIEAQKHKLKVRGYISCIAGCPYEGNIKASAVANIAEKMLELGCYEISLGDTIGIGTPKKIITVLNEIKHLSIMGNLKEFAVHCHDTYGQALVNIYTSLEYGIRVFDSSVAGLGGCPYAAGASGNVATEDLLYLLNEQGFNTDINLNEIIKIGDWISSKLGRSNQSKVGVASIASKKLT
ncbi:hydroxymethylglutaryl-CoA lyase, mitochondrial [Microplitis demolitor]|uniref:hydroxymethylglutaryl-CoA lyase, mitochondrial n=1 Tax=Microplitis demolitor TaxID=69319 RepID=UPI0004CDD718|nr:hydroxymethylglutaryl-CoA lyase, mitochondrial [Microplitis demolitor]